MITSCRCTWPPDAGISFMGKMQCGRWMTAANAGMNTIQRWHLTFFFSRTLRKHLFYGLIYFQILISGSLWEYLLRRNLQDGTWYNSSVSLWCFLIIAFIGTGVTERHARRRLTHIWLAGLKTTNTWVALEFWPITFIVVADIVCLCEFGLPTWNLHFHYHLFQFAKRWLASSGEPLTWSRLHGSTRA